MPRSDTAARIDPENPTLQPATRLPPANNASRARHPRRALPLCSPDQNRTNTSSPGAAPRQTRPCPLSFLVSFQRCPDPEPHRSSHRALKPVGGSRLDCTPDACHNLPATARNTSPATPAASLPLTGKRRRERLKRPEERSPVLQQPPRRTRPRAHLHPSQRRSHLPTRVLGNRHEYQARRPTPLTRAACRGSPDVSVGSTRTRGLGARPGRVASDDPLRVGSSASQCSRVTPRGAANRWKRLCL
jgi:hypothetical protein